MSFVDLNADVRWSEQDIVARMEASIREHCPLSEELILHRKMLGASIGAYTLSPEEVGEIQAYAAVCAQAQTLGRDARADAALLHRVLDAESGAQPLAEGDADGHLLASLRAALRPTPDPAPDPVPEPAPVVPAEPTPAPGSGA